MRSLPPFTALLLSFTSLATAYSRAACQSATKNPLHGCPKNTLLVGKGKKLASIQDAVLSLPENGVPYTILVCPGDYTEQVNVTRPGPLTILGQTSHPNDASKNKVNIIWSNATGTDETGDYDNAYTSTLTIAPTLNASFTGAGPSGSPVAPGTPFGNKNFRTYNLNFINDYRPYSAGPALALSMSYANAGFYYTQFLSYQDTVPSTRHLTIYETDQSTGLRRKIRQRIHVQMYHWRPDRLLLWLRHALGDRLTDQTARLRWRHHRMERNEHHFREQVWSLHPRQSCSKSQQLSAYQARMRPRQTVE